MLPTEGDGEHHDCLAAVTEACSPRLDLKEVPLADPKVELFVDGSASRNKETGLNKVGFAAVTPHETLASGSLPSHLSAQAAELIALKAACKQADGINQLAFTDIRYAFGVEHDFGTIWKHRDFLPSTGKPIAHHTLVAEFLEAVLLHAKLAIFR